MIAAGALPADVPPNFGYVTDAAQKEAQGRLAELVPNAEHVANTNSGHEIQKEQPHMCSKQSATSSRQFVFGADASCGEDGVQRRKRTNDRLCPAAGVAASHRPTGSMMRQKLIGAAGVTYVTTLRKMSKAGASAVAVSLLVASTTMVTPVARL